ncbi:MAG: hypothetical protein L7S72_08065 [Flavobacteriales bacterium]|nr:hypothetical protein [Flavobacteriales bacterium]
MKDVLILSIPLAGILVATYLMLQHFQNKSAFEKEKEIDIQKTKTFFPLQIQAYERVILFLERIDPNNMIIRTHKNGMNAITLHRELLKIVREEYTHNMSQQIYIHPKSWKTVLNAKDETIQILNVAVNNLSADSSGLDLSAKIFESIASKKNSPTENARNSIVKEFQTTIK